MFKERILPMKLDFTPIVTPKQVEQLSTFSEKIWLDFFTEFVGEENVKYILERYASINSTIEQIKLGHRYFSFSCDGEFCGYLDFVMKGKKSAHLNNVYVLPEFRGKGIAKSAVERVEGYCRKEKRTRLLVNVPCKNELALTVYEKLGFKKTKELSDDIGNGYILQSVVMEKSIR